MADNKRIAKNTLFMYFRMILVMIVSLYTSRIVLQVLGVEDYGTYQVVGGIVGFLAFINTTLSQGSSRFLLFEMGKGDKKKVAMLFSTLLNAHILLALFIILLAETIGLWFLYNKLIIPEGRMHAAVFAYQLSIITSFFSLTQTPYSAAIKSHERFDIYAYTSIIDVFAKLAIVYALKVSPIDKLSFYALLLCIVHIAIAVFYRFYCIRHFEETKYQFVLNKSLITKVTSYCGWNFFSNISQVLNSQGLIMLINMFFSPAIVTSISIATTVKDAANSFVENFRVATIPQTVKSYASGDHFQSKTLLINSTKYSFYLLLLLGLPIFLLAPDILYLWLGFIPENSILFLRVIIIISFFQLLNSCLFTAQDIIGKIRKYAVCYSTMMFINIVVIFIFFKMGAPSTTYVFVLLITFIFISMVMQPYLVVSQTEYTLSEIYHLFFSCFFVSVLAIIIPLLLYYYIPDMVPFARLIIITLVSIISVVLCVWYFGMDKKTKKKVLMFVKSKFNK